MPNRKNRSAASALLTVGMFSSVLTFAPGAAADNSIGTSPGVPCVGMITQAAASPESFSDLLAPPAAFGGSGGGGGTGAGAGGGGMGGAGAGGGRGMGPGGSGMGPGGECVCPSSPSGCSSR